MEQQYPTLKSNHNEFNNQNESTLDRKVLDPIHEFINFEQQMWDFIDTPEFQRLRELKQMGVTYLVFPGANHTRFEHSIGTGHLAQKYTKNILKHQPNLIDGSQEYRELLQRDITLSGLCHDLGHGPFSHLFDHNIIKSLKPDIKWTHEDASLAILDRLINNNNIDAPEESVKRIKNLITGDFEKSSDPRWIFDIVANKRNSIDVDKFDYIARDSYFLGLKDTYFDYRRIIKESRVINDEICFPAKMDYKIYELFQARYKFHKTIYSNRATQSIEKMMCDLFLEANIHYNFLKLIEDTDQYLYLTDNFIQEIERSNKPELDKAKQIIKRIKKRDIYKYVSEILLPDELQIQFDEHTFIQNVVSCQPHDGLLPHITINDIHVSFNCINYAKKDQNPVEYVKFFNKNSQIESFYIAKEEVSLLLPNKFQERFIRIFVKEQKHFQTALIAFKNYISKYLQLKVGPVIGNSPIKSPKKETKEDSDT